MQSQLVRPSQEGWEYSRVHLIILVIIEVAMGVELVFKIAEQNWMHVFLVAAIMLAMAVPAVFARRFDLTLPTEIQFATMLFVFATLFLGEVQDFYERFWWWDIALHTTSGVLLGLLGFIVLYLLNESQVVDFSLRPLFVSLFAFFFAVTIGALWEIFEFAMDQLAGLQMQKPMLGDPSGLTDTMWDLIVDTAGAALSTFLGWLYIRRARAVGSDSWVRRFALRYPRLFDS